MAYTNGLAIDQALSVIRFGYADSVDIKGDPAKYRRLPPLVIVPLWNYLGQANEAFFPETGETRHCQSIDGKQRCVDVFGPYAYYDSYLLPRSKTGAWNGDLLHSKRDGAETYYRRNRHYDPLTARFTQEDPIGLAGGLNLYGYAAGDPVNFSDPFGLCPPEDDNLADCPGIFTALGAGIGALMGGFGGGAGGAALCSVAGPAAIACAAGGGIAGAGKGAAVGGAAGALVDGIVQFAKKADIKQVDQAIRQALGRKPTDEERGEFRDHIHETKRGSKDFRFKDLVRLAKELFGVDQ